MIFPSHQMVFSVVWSFTINLSFGERPVKIPVFTIGGINTNNVSMLKNIGLQGVCSVSGILSEKDCKKAVDIMLKNFN